MSCLDWVRANCCCCCCGPRSAPVTDAGDDCAPEAVVTQPVQVSVRIPAGSEMIAATPRVSPDATTVRSVASGGSAATARSGRSTGSPSQRPTPDRQSVSATHLGHAFSFSTRPGFWGLPFELHAIIAKIAGRDIWADILVKNIDLDAIQLEPEVRKFVLLSASRTEELNLHIDLEGWQLRQIACFFVSLRKREQVAASSPLLHLGVPQLSSSPHTPHSLLVLDAMRQGAQGRLPPSAQTSPQQASRSTEADYDAVSSNRRAELIRNGTVDTESALVRLQVCAMKLKDDDFADLQFLKTLKEVHITAAQTITPAIIDTLIKLPKLKKFVLYQADQFTKMQGTQWKDGVEAQFQKLSTLADFEELRCDTLSWPPRSTANSLAADRPALPAASYEPERSNIGGVMSREPSQVSSVVHVAIPGVVRLPKIPGVLGDSAHPSQSSSKRSQHSSVKHSQHSSVQSVVS